MPLLPRTTPVFCLLLDRARSRLTIVRRVDLRWGVLRMAAAHPPGRPLQRLDYLLLVQSSAISWTTLVAFFFLGPILACLFTLHVYFIPCLFKIYMHFLGHCISGLLLRATLCINVIWLRKAIDTFGFDSLCASSEFGTHSWYCQRMGVKSLWSLLTPVGRPTLYVNLVVKVLISIHLFYRLENVEGKAMAIDSSIWIYQFQATMRDREGRALVNGHVLGFLRRISKLLFYGIKPVFVFDGGAPALKRTTLVRWWYTSSSFWELNAVYSENVKTRRAAPLLIMQNWLKSCLLLN